MAEKFQAYKMRLYPNEQQEFQIQRTFGVVRWLYNQMVEMQTKRRKTNPHARYVSRFGMGYLIKQLRKEEPWLKDFDSTALHMVTDQVDRSYQNFFSKRSRYPKFHKRRYSRSYTTNAVGKFPKQNIRFNKIKGEYYIQLPKLDQVRVKGSRVPAMGVKRATISQDSAGRYYVSVMTLYPTANQRISIRPSSSRTANAPMSETKNKIGLDFNIAHIDLSNGEQLMVPKATESEKKHLRLWERRMAHRRLLAKKKEIMLTEQAKNQRIKADSDWHWWESKGYQEAKRHVAKLKATQSHRREAWQQRETTKLLQRFDTVVVEDLSVKPMLKNKHVSRGLSEVGINQFITMLSYKAEWHDEKQIIKVNPANTSQTCFNCGFVMGTGDTEKLTLSQRQWICPNCGEQHLRDLNAAKNILAKADL